MRGRVWAGARAAAYVGAVAMSAACNDPTPPAGALSVPATPSPAPASMVAAGGKQSNAAAAPAEAGPAMAEAKALFAQRCVMCHGVSGHGDGAAAASLTPKPRNYSDAAWQKATDDEHIRMVIIGGGPAVGKSMMMPANPDLKDKPQVVEGLIKIVRAFGKA